MSSHTVLRDACPEEADLLSALALRSKAHWGYPDDFIEACREELSYSGEMISDDRYTFCVAQEAGSVCGFYAIEWQDERQCELEALFVEPRMIGRGVGRTLFQHATAVARARGAQRMVVQGDPHARAFYLSTGGSCTGERESASVPGRFLPVFEYLL